MTMKKEENEAFHWQNDGHKLRIEWLCRLVLYLATFDSQIRYSNSILTFDPYIRYSCQASILFTLLSSFTLIIMSTIIIIMVIIKSQCSLYYNARGRMFGLVIQFRHTMPMNKHIVCYLIGANSETNKRKRLDTLARQTQSHKRTSLNWLSLHVIINDDYYESVIMQHSHRPSKWHVNGCYANYSIVGSQLTSDEI